MNNPIPYTSEYVKSKAKKVLGKYIFSKKLYNYIINNLKAIEQLRDYIAFIEIPQKSNIIYHIGCNPDMFYVYGTYPTITGKVIIKTFPYKNQDEAEYMKICATELYDMLTQEN